jgi:hypothetical protein
MSRHRRNVVVFFAVSLWGLSLGETVQFAAADQITGSGSIDTIFKAGFTTSFPVPSVKTTALLVTDITADSLAADLGFQKSDTILINSVNGNNRDTASGWKELIDKATKSGVSQIEITRNGQPQPKIRIANDAITTIANNLGLELSQFAAKTANSPATFSIASSKGISLQADVRQSDKVTLQIDGVLIAGQFDFLVKVD